ncbi:UNKNOWN [Stylonychia lemnae]|uniref:Kelch motif family protein n=1 Tax=Stylonychia lemnae TaxID=5949 RepID=A0A078A233_STYLE|nr:UNKNOWN [Stylonychia lemnae]|eukprot:CDW75558.1 UNKNOWN [Stylonychia lemnae]
MNDPNKQKDQGKQNRQESILQYVNPSKILTSFLDIQKKNEKKVNECIQRQRMPEYNEEEKAKKPKKKKRQKKQNQKEVRKQVIQVLTTQEKELMKFKQIVQANQSKSLDHERIKQSLFYFMNNNLTLERLELDSNISEQDFQQLKYLSPKNKAQFAIIEIEFLRLGQSIWKTFVIGILPVIILHEVDQNGKIRLIKTRIQLPNVRHFAWTTNDKQQLFLTGGQKCYEKTYYGVKDNQGFDFKLSNDSDKIMINKISNVPKLNHPRFGHSCFYFRERLYVIFGRKKQYKVGRVKYDKYSLYHLSFEFWDTRETPEFFTEQILNYPLEVEKQMLFQIPQTDQFYFFGGIEPDQNNKLEHKSSLYSLKVTETEVIQEQLQNIKEQNIDQENSQQIKALYAHEKRKKKYRSKKEDDFKQVIDIEIQIMDEQLQFKGNPQFHSSLQNRICSQDGMKWAFVDLDNFKHFLDLKEKRIFYDDTVRLQEDEEANDDQNIQDLNYIGIFEQDRDDQVNWIVDYNNGITKLEPTEELDRKDI